MQNVFAVNKFSNFALLQEYPQIKLIEQKLLKIVIARKKNKNE